MDQTYLLAPRRRRARGRWSHSRVHHGAGPGHPRMPTGESSFGVSTEGMKICPKCGMGNLWTERRCSALRAALKG